MKRTHSLGAAAFAIGLALLSGCVGGEAPATTTPPPQPQEVTLAVITYGSFDLTTLLARYEAEHPEITINQELLATEADAHAALTEALADGALPGSVVAIEDAWLGELFEHPEATVDLGPFGAAGAAGQWFDWSLAQGTDAAGRVVALPMTSRPLAVCFNGTRLAAAGFPSEPEKVAALLEGDWIHAVEIATMYKEGTGKPFFDSAGSVWQAMAAQLQGGYTDETGAVNLATNQALGGRWTVLTGMVAAGLTAKQTPGDWTGGTALVDGSFAAFICEPGSLRGAEQAIAAVGGDASTGWAVADVLPGGAASAGGISLAVTSDAATKDAAAALALWLAAPDQQLAAATAAGLTPAGASAQALGAPTLGTSNVFGEADIASLLTSRSEGVVVRTRGPFDAFILQEAFAPAVAGLEQGTLTADQAWQQVLSTAATVAPAPPSPTP